MKNKISLLVIYRDDKPSADCALRRGKRKKITITKIIFTRYITKESLITTDLNYIIFLLRRFNPIPGHDLPLRGLVVSVSGHTTLGRAPLDE